MACDAMFAQRVRACAADVDPLPLQILDAGCGRGTVALDLRGIEHRVVGIDHDEPALRAHAAGRSDLAEARFGDLRTVPLPPRAFDVVHCAFLLERSAHAELILDRIMAALKPGGILLLRFHDRGSVYGFCDRLLPGRLRGLVWHRTHRGGPTRWAAGPPAAVYEPIVSASGVRWYATMRGLVIAEQYAVITGTKADGRPATIRPARAIRRLVRALARGRLDAGHDSLAFVIRKPESRFARVV